MEHRTPGPFEASGLPYSDAYEVIPPKERGAGAHAHARPRGDHLPAPVPSIVELDSTLLKEVPSIPPPIHFSPGLAVLAAASPVHGLAVPPSPAVFEPTRKSGGAKRTVAVFAAVATCTVAFAALGATWIYGRGSEAAPIAAPSVEPESLRDTSFSGALPRARENTPTNGPSRREALGSHAFRAARTSRPAAVEPVIRVRAPALPPNPGLTARVPQSLIYAAPGQSCGERCRGNIDCLLACRPAGSDARANALVLPEPTPAQISIAMQSVRGAVLMCGLSLGANAPRVAQVTVTFGSSGRVTGASLGAALRNTPAGDCVVRAVERAHVPPFEHSSFATQTSFSIQ